MNRRLVPGRREETDAARVVLGPEGSGRGFDVGTLGNHEFDEGKDEMLRLIRGG